MSKNITTFYRIPAPYSMGDTFIEVWGYGSPEIALRDALIAMSE